MTQENVAVTRIWNPFRVRRVHNVNGDQLTYYKDWFTPHQTLERLVEKTDGQCTAWGPLLAHCLKCHGFDASEKHLDGILRDGEILLPIILVKNWRFVGKGISNFRIYPYVNVIPTDGKYVVENAYVWRYAQVADIRCLAGQGTSNPRANFRGHCVAKIKKDDRIFDPSYGKIYNGRENMEQRAIAGYGQVFETFPVSEEITKTDLDGDGKIEGTAKVPSLLIRRADKDTTLRYR